MSGQQLGTGWVRKDKLEFDSLSSKPLGSPERLDDLATKAKRAFEGERFVYQPVMPRPAGGPTEAISATLKFVTGSGSICYFQPTDGSLPVLAAPTAVVDFAGPSSGLVLRNWERQTVSAILNPNHFLGEDFELLVEDGVVVRATRVVHAIPKLDLATLVNPVGGHAALTR
ncbi:MAG: hypothetical protein ACKVVT_05340 [Dehalococcoidia bacterium]